MMKRCPYCKERIKTDAIKCKHCGEWLNVEKKEKGVKQTMIEDTQNESKENLEVEDKPKDVSLISLKPTQKLRERIKGKDKTQKTIYKWMWISVIICAISLFLLLIAFEIPTLSIILKLILLLSFLSSIVFFYLGLVTGRTEAESAAFKMTDVFENKKRESLNKIERLTKGQIESLFTNDKKRFDEWSSYYYNNDRRYYKEVVKPLMNTNSLALNERKLILEKQISFLVQRGYSITSSTDTTATLSKPKEFKFCDALLWFFIGGIGFFIYIFLYINQSDAVIHIDIDENFDVNTSIL